MNKRAVNPTLFKFLDRFTAVLSSITTTVFVSLTVILILLEQMGDNRTVAVITKMFPARSLTLVYTMLIALSVAGIIAMLCYNFDMLWGILIADGMLKTAASLFLAVIIKKPLLFTAVAACVIYLLSAVLRLLITPASACPDCEAESDKEG